MTWHQKLPLCPFLSLLPVTSPKVMTKFKHHRLVMPALNFMKTESYRNHSFVSGYCKSTLHLWDSSMMMHVTIICSVLLHVIYYHVHLISCVWLFATPWTAERPAFLSFTISQSAQTHVHWVDGAIWPSYPLSPPSPPALNPSQDYTQIYYKKLKFIELMHTDTYRPYVMPFKVKRNVNKDAILNDNCTKL